MLYWRVRRNKSKGFSFSLNQWLLILMECMGVARGTLGIVGSVRYVISLFLYAPIFVYLGVGVFRFQYRSGLSKFSARFQDLCCCYCFF